MLQSFSKLLSYTKHSTTSLERTNDEFVLAPIFSLFGSCTVHANSVASPLRQGHLVLSLLPDGRVDSLFGHGLRQHLKLVTIAWHRVKEYTLHESNLNANNDRT